MENHTPYLAIIADKSPFELSCIFDSNNELIPEPSLKWQVYRNENCKSIGFWDNSDYLKKLFKALVKGKKTWRTKELRQFCKDHDFNYINVKKDLIEVYKRSLKLKMWK